MLSKTIDRVQFCIKRDKIVKIMVFYDLLEDQFDESNLQNDVQETLFWTGVCLQERRGERQEIMALMIAFVIQFNGSPDVLPG